MEKEIQMANKLEECSISLVIKEIKHQATMNYISLVRLAEKNLNLILNVRVCGNGDSGPLWVTLQIGTVALRDKSTCSAAPRENARV